MTQLDEISQTKKKLNEVSKSFCLAKWYQVTIHLQSGQTHSCHHPKAHLIPTEELKISPSALHNTKFKKLQRKKMLEGQRPEECDYCWNIEDVSEDQVSDRHIKSNDEWALPYLQEAANLPWDADVLPKYVEVSFSHKCNFKCAYCQPFVSSKWMAEIQQFGPYPTHHRYNSIEFVSESAAFPVEDEDINPYVKAFWEWWPKLKKELKVFRITGGEPLLSKSTFRIMDDLLVDPNPGLDLAINSNLGVPDQLIGQFIEKSKKLLEKKSVKAFTVFTSIDTWGPATEFIRFGMNLEVFEKNLNRIIEEIPGVNLSIMCTFNLFSSMKFEDLVDRVILWKKKCQDLGNGSKVVFDVSYLRHPQFLSLNLMPQKEIERLERSLKKMKENHISVVGFPAGFLDFEVIKLERLIEYAKKEPFVGFTRQHFLADMAAFLHEYDRRRGTDFRKTFPELELLFIEADMALELRKAREL